MQCFRRKIDDCFGRLAREQPELTVLFTCSLRFCEHAVATRGVSRRDFLLQHVPVFDHFAVRYSKDIDRDHRLWPPAGITAVHHDEITIRDGHARFIRLIRRIGRRSATANCASGISSSRGLRAWRSLDAKAWIPR